jgi:hypothetical protein
LTFLGFVDFDFHVPKLIEVCIKLAYRIFGQEVKVYLWIRNDLLISFSFDLEEDIDEKIGLVVSSFDIVQLAHDVQLEPEGTSVVRLAIQVVPYSECISEENL